MNDHIDGHYELHLLIFKMSNGSSYYEAYNRLLTPHVKAFREKERKLFLSFSLSLSLFLSLSQFSSLIPSSILYIKARYISSLLFWFTLYLSLFYNNLLLFIIIMRPTPLPFPFILPNFLLFIYLLFITHHRTTTFPFWIL